MFKFIKIFGFCLFCITNCTVSQKKIDDQIIPTNLEIDSVLIEPNKVFLDDKIYFVSINKILNKREIQLLRNDINHAHKEQIKFAPECHLVFYSEKDSLIVGFTPPDLIKFDGLTYVVTNSLLRKIEIKKK
jgi:hypothetical protein